MKHLIYIFAVLLLFSCTNKADENKVKEVEINKEAVRLNEEALQIYQNYILNKDSVLKAIALLNKAVEIEPNYFVALGNIAAFQINSGQIEEGINTYKRIEKIRPNSEETKFMIGMEYFIIQTEILS